MALYPSSVYKTFEYPTPMQSVFEDFNDLFSDALFHPFCDLRGEQLRPQRRQPPQHRFFTTAVKLADFRADEVAVKVDDGCVKISAKHEEGEDMSEVRKTVRLPEDADADKLETRFTKEGFLVIRAPYTRSEKQQQQQQQQQQLQLTDQQQQLAANWPQLRQLLRGPGITDLREQLVKDDEGNTIFRVPVPVRDFQPEEISVKQVGDKVVVRCEHKEERDGQLVHRSAHREFLLPQGADKQKLRSRLTDQGVLVIEAPAQDLALPEPKEIPVQVPQAEQQQ